MKKVKKKKNQPSELDSLVILGDKLRAEIATSVGIIIWTTGMMHEGTQDSVSVQALTTALKGGLSLGQEAIMISKSFLTLQAPKQAMDVACAAVGLANRLCFMLGYLDMDSVPESVRAIMTRIDALALDSGEVFQLALEVNSLPQQETRPTEEGNISEWGVL